MVEHRIRIMALNSAVVIALGVAVSIVTSTVVAARAYRGKFAEAARVQQDITVKGKAVTRVRSDRGNWWVTIRGEGPTLVEAHETLQVGVRRVEEFLAKFGLDQADVTWNAIATQIHYDRDEEGRATRDVIDYTLSRTIAVGSDDVTLIAEAAGRVTDLIQEGVMVVSTGPEYVYTRVGEEKVRLLAAAAHDARVRADRIASKTGGRITVVRDVRQGVIQITRPDSTRVTSYGVYDTTTIKKDISVVVTVTFGIEGT